MANKAGKPPIVNPPADHNAKPLTDDQRDALYLTHVDQARKDNAALEKAMEGVRAVRKVRTRNRTLCRTDGFPLEKLDRNLKREEMDWDELVKLAAVEAQMDRAQGLPTTGTEQLDLFGVPRTSTGEPSLDRDDNWFAALGYRAGKMGADQAVPDSVPPQHRAAYEQGYGDGQKAVVAAWEIRKELEKNRVPVQ